MNLNLIEKTITLEKVAHWRFGVIWKLWNVTHLVHYNYKEIQCLLEPNIYNKNYAEVVQYIPVNLVSLIINSVWVLAYQLYTPGDQYFLSEDHLTGTLPDSTYEIKE